MGVRAAGDGATQPAAVPSPALLLLTGPSRGHQTARPAGTVATPFSASREQVRGHPREVVLMWFAHPCACALTRRRVVPHTGTAARLVLLGMSMVLAVGMASAQDAPDANCTCLFRRTPRGTRSPHCSTIREHAWLRFNASFY